MPDHDNITEAISAEFDAALDSLRNDIAPQLRHRMSLAAARAAAHLDTYMRRPEMREASLEALRWEQAYLETLAARSEFEARTAFRDAAVGAIQKFLLPLL
jgi:hypothetical protein